jgi:hypothetical protein
MVSVLQVALWNIGFRAFQDNKVTTSMEPGFSSGEDLSSNQRREDTGKIQTQLSSFQGCLMHFS